MIGLMPSFNPAGDRFVFARRPARFLARAPRRLAGRRYVPNCCDKIVGTRVAIRLQRFDQSFLSELLVDTSGGKLRPEV